MTTTELKLKIFENVLKTNDEKFLEEINDVLNLKSNQQYEIVLTEYQKKRIRESIEQYERGEYKTSEEVFSEIDKWLNK